MIKKIITSFIGLMLVCNLGYSDQQDKPEYNNIIEAPNILIPVIIKPTGKYSSIPTDQLLAHWILDDLTDSWSINNLMNYGAISTNGLKAITNTAYYFDGNAHYITTANGKDWEPNNGYLTMCCWIKVNGSHTHSPLSIANVNPLSGPNDELCLYVFATGKVWFFAEKRGGDYDYVEANVNVNDGNWHHLVGTMNGTSRAIDIW